MKLSTRLNAQELEAQARALEAQIKKLDRRGFHATPSERESVVALKKLRLAAKDRLADVRH